MKSAGIVRKIDELGRFVIPKETRELLGINIGDSLEIFMDGEEIILRKYAPGCTFCGNMNDLIIFKGINICGECKRVLSKLKCNK